MALWDRFFGFRERFRRLDRKFQALIGSQILFALVVLRAHNNREDTKHQLARETTKTTPNPQQQQQQQQQ